MDRSDRLLAQRAELDAFERGQKDHAKEILFNHGLGNAAETLDGVQGQAEAARGRARGLMGRIGGWFGGGRK